jgi:GNAT superfamily N-acetyltransferase
VADLYRLWERPPDSEEYRSLCRAVGWEEFINFDAARASLANSLYHVVALYDEVVIGMARVVGDGALFFYIQDVIVIPAHQGRGVGALLIGRAMDYLTGHAPEKAFVGLFAVEGTLPFYARYGFAVDPGLTGLSCVAPV